MLSSSTLAAEKNGFDLSNALLSADEIFRGGPPKDGIPSIDEPIFASADDADFIDEDEWVLGIKTAAGARAYPIKILNWHEIVNDEMGGLKFVVTFCPLCGSGVVFRSAIDGNDLQFGVSGLLYNSDVLLYDRATESLWSQLLRKAVSGPYKGTALQTLPVHHTTWGDWQKRHPQSEVLTPQTGYSRDYEGNPYAGYEDEEHIYFPVGEKSTAYHPKERVLGVSVGNRHKAYPFLELEKNNRPQFFDEINGKRVSIHWNADDRVAYASFEDGEGRRGRFYDLVLVRMVCLPSRHGGFFRALIQNFAFYS